MKVKRCNSLPSVPAETVDISRSNSEAPEIIIILQTASGSNDHAKPRGENQQWKLFFIDYIVVYI